MTSHTYKAPSIVDAVSVDTWEVETTLINICNGMIRFLLHHQPHNNYTQKGLTECVCVLLTHALKPISFITTQARTTVTASVVLTDTVLMTLRDVSLALIHIGTINTISCKPHVTGAVETAKCVVAGGIHMAAIQRAVRAFINICRMYGDRVDTH